MRQRRDPLRPRRRSMHRRRDRLRRRRCPLLRRRRWLLRSSHPLRRRSRDGAEHRHGCSGAGPCLLQGRGSLRRRRGCGGWIRGSGGCGSARPLRSSAGGAGGSHRTAHFAGVGADSAPLDLDAAARAPGANDDRAADVAPGAGPVRPCAGAAARISRAERERHGSSTAVTPPGSSAAGRAWPRGASPGGGGRAASRPAPRRWPPASPG